MIAFSRVSFSSFKCINYSIVSIRTWRLFDLFTIIKYCFLLRWIQNWACSLISKKEISIRYFLEVSKTLAIFSSGTLPHLIMISILNTSWPDLYSSAQFHFSSFGLFCFQPYYFISVSKLRSLMQPHVHLYNEYEEISKVLISEALSFFYFRFNVFYYYLQVIT